MSDIDKTWTLLGEIDDSESYEIDITAIYRRPDGVFILAIAEGCSCWDGDYDIEEFVDLDAIEASFHTVTADERRWVTTFNRSPRADDSGATGYR